MEILLEKEGVVIVVAEEVIVVDLEVVVIEVETVAEDEIEVEVKIAGVIVEVVDGKVESLTVAQIETLLQVVKAKEVIYVIIATNQVTLLEIARTKH